MAWQGISPVKTHSRNPVLKSVLDPGGKSRWGFIPLSIGEDFLDPLYGSRPKGLQQSVKRLKSGAAVEIKERML